LNFCGIYSTLKKIGHNRYQWGKGSCNNAGIRPEDHKDYDTLVSDALLKRGQNSARILQAVPDVQAAVDLLEAEHAAQVPVLPAS